MKFDFELENAIEQIKSRNPKKILIQLPEGMKTYTAEIVSQLAINTKTDILVSGNSNWGGCDLALDEAKNLKVDLLVHFGHAQFIKNVDFPVLYIEVKDNTDLNSLLMQSLDKLSSFHNIGLVSSIQHLHKLNEVKEFYEKNNKKITIPEKKGFAAYNGHVVGCEYNSLKSMVDKVDAFIVIGNQFHSLGAALSVPILTAGS